MILFPVLLLLNSLISFTVQYSNVMYMQVGFGGSPDESGETTLDAMIMDGETLDVSFSFHHKYGVLTMITRFF